MLAYDDKNNTGTKTESQFVTLKPLNQATNSVSAEIDPKTLEPTKGQIVKWQEEAASKGMEYKGYGTGEKGIQAIIQPRAPKLDPVVEAQKNSEYTTLRNKEIDAINESNRKAKAIHATDTQKTIKGVIDVVAPRSPADYGSRGLAEQYAQDSRFASHPFLFYSKDARTNFDAELAKGKDAQNLPGLSQYEEQKKDFEKKISYRSHAEKTQEWEDMKFQQARTGLEQQQLQLESSREQINNSRSLQAYREQQGQIKLANAEIKRRAGLNKELNKPISEVSALRKWQIVTQEGGGMSVVNATKIAEHLPVELRKSFISRAVANMEDVSRNQDQVNAEIVAGNEGETSAGKISVSTESAIAQDIKDMTKDELPEDQIIKIAREKHSGQEVNVAVDEAILNNLNLVRSGGNKEAEKLISEKTDSDIKEFENAVGQIKVWADYVLSTGNNEAAMNALGITRSQLMRYDDGGVMNAILAATGKSMSNDNSTGREMLYEKLNPSIIKERTPEKDAVDSLVSSLKNFRDGLIVSMADKNAQKKEDLAKTFPGTKSSDYVVSGTGEKQIALFVPSGLGLDRDIIRTKLDDAASDPESMKRLEQDLGKDSDTGLYGKKLGFNREAWDKFENTSYTKLPDVVKSVLKTGEAQDAAREYHYSDNKYQADLVDKGISSGAFEDVVAKKVEGNLTIDHNVQNLGTYSLSESLKESNANAKAVEFAELNVGPKSALNKLFSSSAPIDKKLSDAENQKAKAENFLTMLEGKAGKGGIDFVPPKEADPFNEKTRTLREDAGLTDYTYWMGKPIPKETNTWGAKVAKTIRNTPDLRRIFANGDKESMMAAALLAADLNEKKDQKDYIDKVTVLSQRLAGENPRLKEINALRLTLPEMLAALPDQKALLSPERYEELLAVLRDEIADFETQTKEVFQDASEALYKVRRNGGTVAFSSDPKLNAKETLDYQPILENWKKLTEGGGLDIVRLKKEFTSEEFEKQKLEYASHTTGENIAIAKKRRYPSG